jgi:hypothetical protein
MYDKHGVESGKLAGLTGRPIDIRSPNTLLPTATELRLYDLGASTGIHSPRHLNCQRRDKSTVLSEFTAPKKTDKMIPVALTVHNTQTLVSCNGS